MIARAGECVLVVVQSRDTTTIACSLRAIDDSGGATRHFLTRGEFRFPDVRPSLSFSPLLYTVYPLIDVFSHRQVLRGSRDIFITLPITLDLLFFSVELTKFYTLTYDLACFFFIGLIIHSCSVTRRCILSL